MITNHGGKDMNVCTKFHSNQSSICKYLCKDVSPCCCEYRHCKKKKLLPPTRLSSCDHVIYRGRDGTKGATAVVHLAFFSERDYGKFATFKGCHHSMCPCVTHYSLNGENWCCKCQLQTHTRSLRGLWTHLGSHTHGVAGGRSWA